MRLAGDHHLQRRIVAEDALDALGVVCEEEEPLVGRDPAGKADGQRAGVEALGRELDVRRILTAQQPILHALRPHVVDELGASSGAGSPQLVVRDVGDGLPGLG